MTCDESKPAHLSFNGVKVLENLSVLQDSLQLPPFEAFQVLIIYFPISDSSPPLRNSSSFSSDQSINPSHLPSSSHRLQHSINPKNVRKKILDEEKFHRRRCVRELRRCKKCRVWLCAGKILFQE